MSESNFAGINFGYDSDSIFRERNKTMCDRWKHSQAQFSDCSIDAVSNSHGVFKIRGQTNKYSGDNLFVKYWASAPPTYSLSFAGSGLPYPNEHEAFENTPNQGVSTVTNGVFNFTLQYPNSYYNQLGKKYVVPEVKLQFCSGNKDLSNVLVLKLGQGIPYRSLTWPRKRNWNVGPMFFCNNNLPVRNQEQILRDSAYPKVNEEASNFWGLVPPH